MNFMNSVVNFFKDGGVFLYPLALIFVVGVSIAIERYVYLTRETIRNRSLWDSLVPALSAALISALTTRLPPAPEVQVPVGLCVALVAAPLTVKLYGSSSQLPAAPFGAEALMVIPVTSSTWPEVSTLPPLPPSRPPLASSLPQTTVVPSDHAVIVPPLPCMNPWKNMFCGVNHQSALRDTSGRLRVEHLVPVNLH